MEDELLFWLFSFASPCAFGFAFVAGNVGNGLSHESVSGDLISSRILFGGCFDFFGSSNCVEIFAVLGLEVSAGLFLRGGAF